ncbi:MAG: fatty-acid oxidation protein subunit alpha [Desulfobacteraceae bacterium]|nr:fatty-acid oxidation protein subunit alpha [Desulfobacteraceae bacterium]
MAAPDKYHDVVKHALLKEGWTITDDPLYLKYGGVDYAIDFGAEKLIAAEKNGQRIAVEVKSFLSDSATYEFHHVVGQFTDYRIMLSQVEPKRLLYIAVPSDVYHSFFQIPFIQLVIQNVQMKLLIYKIQEEVIEIWTE